MEAMSFEDDFPSIAIDSFKDHYVLVLDLIFRKDAAEKYHYQKLVGEPQSWELNFTHLPKHVTEPFVLGERMSLVAVDKFGVAGKNL